MNVEIKGLTFIPYTLACPAQYDVEDSEGTHVGYVRLRWGILRCDYPDWGGEIIYTHNFHEDFKGIFDSDEERDEYFGLIADEILKRTSTLKLNM